VLSYEALVARNSDFDPQVMIASAQRETKLPGGATMCVLEMDGVKLKAATVGDAGFRVIRSGEVVLASTPRQHQFDCPYQLGYVELVDYVNTAKDAELLEFQVKPGDLVVAASDGLFDNVFDADIVRVVTDAVKVGGTALGETKAASDALVKLARKNAEDKDYESPYAVEKNADPSFKPKNPFASLFQGQSTFIGGKMDDITVVVGKVVATAEASTDLKEAVAASEELANALETTRENAREAEAKIVRKVDMRNKIKYGDKYKPAVTTSEPPMLSAEEIAALPELSAEEIEAMDKETVIARLQERGISAGKRSPVWRLKEQLGQVSGKR